jgi:hypothetical protein
LPPPTTRTLGPSTWPLRCVASNVKHTLRINLFVCFQGRECSRRERYPGRHPLGISAPESPQPTTTQELCHRRSRLYVKTYVRREPFLMFWFFSAISNALSSINTVSIDKSKVGPIDPLKRSETIMLPAGSAGCRLLQESFAV